MIHPILAAAALTADQAVLQDSASPTELLAHLETRIVALDDGEAILDYVLCYADRRSSVSPYVAFLPPEDLYPQFAALRIEFSGQLGSITYQEERALLQRVESRVDERKGTTGCQYTLIPSPERARIIAERASYLRDAINGRADPQVEVAALVAEHITNLANLPEGDIPLSLSVCRQRYPERFQGQNIPPGTFPSYETALSDALDEFGANYSKFMMSHAFFDEDAIWTAAYDARVPEMS